MKKIYICGSNKENGNGSIENPFSDFDAVKQFIESTDDDVTVYIKGGRYFFNKSLVFDKEYGGKVKFVPYDNEKVYFDGGIVINNALVKKTTDNEVLDRIIDKKAHEHIYEIDLSSYDIQFADYGARGFRRAYVPSGNEFYINSEAQYISRYPNEGEPEIPLTRVVDSGSNPYQCDFSMHPCTFVYDDERCSLWNMADDFYISGIFTWAFADDTQKAAKIDTENKTITTELPHLPSLIAKPHSRWHALNLLEEIDVPGEYFIDRKTKKLYFYPPNVDLSSALLQLSVLETPLIMLKDTKNITFENIIIENTRGTAIYMENTSECLIKSCTIRNIGMLAAQIGQGATALAEGMHNAHGIQSPKLGVPKGESGIMGSWHEMLYQFAAWNNNGGYNNGIQGCEIYNTGVGGIMLGGGDRKTLEPAGNYVDNCHIYKTNRLDKTYKGGINIMGVGNRISHCKIHDMPGFAIYLHGNDHKIYYNEIYDVINDVSDAGAIYMGRDITEIGNEFCYNFIHDIYGSKNKSIGICAIYFDDGAGFNCVKGNYFYHVIQRDAQSPGGVMGTIFWGWGGRTSVSDNIFIECPNPLSSCNYTANLFRKHFMGEKGETFIPRMNAKDKDDFRGVDITDTVWRERYPYLYGLYTGEDLIDTCVVYNNLFPMDTRWFKDPQNLDFTIIDAEKCQDNLLKFVIDPIMGINDEEVHFTVTDFGKIGLY